MSWARNVPLAVAVPLAGLALLLFGAGFLWLFRARGRADRALRLQPGEMAPDLERRLGSIRPVQTLLVDPTAGRAATQPYSASRAHNDRIAATRDLVLLALPELAATPDLLTRVAALRVALDWLGVDVGRIPRGADDQQAFARVCLDAALATSAADSQEDLEIRSVLRHLADGDPEWAEVADLALRSR